MMYNVLLHFVFNIHTSQIKKYTIQKEKQRMFYSFHYRVKISGDREFL